MNNPFFTDNFTFVNYGSEHGLVILLAILLSAGVLLFAKKKLNEDQQKLFGFYLAIIILISQLSKVWIKLSLNTFDKTTDLPLHLCNMMPFFVPFAMLFKNRTIWAILFFWIMGGTFQALFSPTLQHSFPHYEFWRYWIVHCGLVMIMIYGAYVLGFRLYFKDAVISAILLNLLALIIYFVNLQLDANYLYLIAKPRGTTLYSFLGPWPWYILQLELVLVILFSLIYLPFYLLNKIEKKNRLPIKQDVL